MRDYFTILRDYFYDYFTDFFVIIQVLRLLVYVIVFKFWIIHDYFTASAPGKWECADSNSCQ